MCNSPYSPRASARTFSTDSSARFSKSRTSSRKSFPSAVRVTPRGLRRRRSTPISSSKSCTWRLKAGWATRSCAAARVKFNASPTARKYRRCRSSIAEFHYAGKAWLRNQRGIGHISNEKANCCTENERKHMSRTYKAVQVTKPGKLEVVERTVIEPAFGQVRIHVEACGVCHTDALTVENGFPGLTYPRVPGHEVIGEIEAVGPGVQGW